VSPASDWLTVAPLGTSCPQARGRGPPGVKTTSAQLPAEPAAPPEPEEPPEPASPPELPAPVERHAWSALDEASGVRACSAVIIVVERAALWVNTEVGLMVVIMLTLAFVRPTALGVSCEARVELATVQAAGLRPPGSLLRRPRARVRQRP
jgi:hypothetical protein